MKKVLMISMCFVLILSLLGCEKKNKIVTIYSKDGTKYVGQVVDGKPSGKGKITYTNGTTLEGTFVEGLLQGKGFEKEEDGSTYKGNFEAGKMSGKGTLFSAKDGSTYTGEFAEGKANGKGILKLKDGSELKGTFKDGQLEKATTEDANDSNKDNGTYSAAADSEN